MNASFDQSYTPAPDMPLRASDFRRRARESLKNQWGNGFLVALIYEYLPALVALVLFAFAMVSYFVAIFGGAGAIGMVIMLIFVILAMAVVFLMTAPLTAGVARFHLNVLDRSPETKVGNVFSGFRRGFWKSVRLLLAQVGITVGIELVGLIVLAVCSTYMTDDYTATENGIAVLITVITVIVMFVVVFAVLIRYALSFYILVEHPEMDVIEILHTSAKLMRGNKWRYVCLMCSFLGWILLASICTSGFGQAILMPYISAAQAVFYREVSGTAVPQAPAVTVTPDDYFPNA